jgi:hypothetical protein
MCLFWSGECTEGNPLASVIVKVVIFCKRGIFVPPDKLLSWLGKLNIVSDVFNKAAKETDNSPCVMINETSKVR